MTILSLILRTRGSRLDSCYFASLVTCLIALDVPTCSKPLKLLKYIVIWFMYNFSFREYAEQNAEEFSKFQKTLQLPFSGLVSSGCFGWRLYINVQWAISGRQSRDLAEPKGRELFNLGRPCGWGKQVTGLFLRPLLKHPVLRFCPIMAAPLTQSTPRDLYKLGVSKLFWQRATAVKVDWFTGHVI
jgi:hypothetical protein